MIKSAINRILELAKPWEADNKLWKVEAVERIADWLSKKLPSIPIVA